MSWFDRIKTDLVITTPDGKEYHPDWLNATKTKEFNLAEFEFPGIEGTLVKRGLAKGRRFNIEIYFQGEDHLDASSNFEISSDDPRPWNISHPLYGLILVQPASLHFDNRDANISKVTGVVVETIDTVFPKMSFDPASKISFDKNALDVVTNNSFAFTLPAPSIADQTALTTNLGKMYAEGSKRVLNSIDAESYFNLFNKANALILRATQDPLNAIRAVQSVINAPIFFVDSVKNRIGSLTTQYNSLRTQVLSLTGKSQKKIYENNGGSLISAMTLASVTNPDYKNRNDVLQTIEAIIDNYNLFIADLDSIKSDNNGTPGSYIPDADSISQLTSLVNFTVSNLFNISISAKQERILYTEKDTNVILLAHRLYGLTPDDATIDQLIADNSITLNELLVIPKDRKIVWYV